MRPTLQTNPEMQAQHEAFLERRARMGFASAPKPVPFDRVRLKARLVHEHPIGPKLPARMNVFRIGATFTSATQSDAAVIRAQTRRARETIAATAYETGFSVAEMLGPRRPGPLALARHLAMFRVHRDHGLSFAQIGKLFGGRDHTTCLYAVQRIERLAAAGEITP